MSKKALGSLMPKGHVLLVKDERRANLFVHKNIKS